MGVLVGREGVLRITERFADPASRVRPTLVIEGDAGMGKTTIWRAALTSAGERGHRALMARPAESETGLAYSVVTDLIGPVYDELRSELAPPQARALGAALLRGDSDEPVELRAVAMAVVSVLSLLAAKRSVLVGVDDVQWLDPASERVLAFVTRRLPDGVGVLLAVRQGVDSPPMKALQSMPDDLVERVVLPPLTLAALRQLVSDRIGLALSRPMLARLATASGGNPLFALEIGRALASLPVEPGPSDLLPVPSTLQHLLATRVDALSGPARAALLVAAALSRPTAAVVALAMPGADVESALSEARRADVIVSEPDRIRFTHPLFASAVYGAADPDARQALHRRLADAVGDPDERARHLAAGERPDEAIAAELERAAARAALRGAQDTAADLFAAAARRTPQGAGDALARRSLGQAAARNATGDFTGARRHAERALDTADAPGLRTGALLLLASIEWFDGAAGTATRLAEEALSAAGDDRELRAPIHADLVRLSFSWDLRSALAHADKAIDLLSEERQPATLARVLVDRVFGSALRGEPASVDLFARALTLEQHSLTLGGAPQPMPLLWYHCTDDVAAALTRSTLEERWYRERGEEVWLADRLSHRAVAELHAGDWAAAERHAEESCRAVETLALGGPRAMVFEKRALVDAHRGRTARARATLLQLLEGFERTDQSWWTALTLSTLALVEFVDGDHRAADTALTRMHALAEDVGVVDVLFDRSEPFHVEALLELGQVGRARAILERLEDRGRRLPRPWITASLPRVRALVAADEGDLDAALSCLGQVDSSLAQVLPFEHGWTLLVKGRVERRAKQKRAAAESLGQALELFERLGAPAFSARTTNELARVGLRQTGPGLTPTELLVARYAATGMTNREVAQAAFISQKTVEANLAKVYRKLGIRSRAELGSHMSAAERADRPQT